MDNPNNSLPLDLTILIPCLNEQGSIAHCVHQGQQFLEKNAIHGEVLVADNNSEDQSAVLAEKAGARIIHVADRGYGNALIAGIKMARGRFIIMGDADGAHDLSALEAFWEKLQTGYDCVIGNRFAEKMSPSTMPFLHRYLGNPLLSGIAKLFFRSRINDFHCGLRGFRTHSVRALSLQCPGMEFASEIIIKATQRNMRITEVPTTLHKEFAPNRSSHLRTWTDGWRHLRLLLILSPRWLFLYPGCIFFTLGLLTLTVALLDTSESQFGTYTIMVGSAFFICGLQIIIFSMLAEIFCENIGLTSELLWFKRFQKYHILETGLAVGFILLLLGMVGSVWSVFIWTQAIETDFETRLRVAIPSVTLIISSLQIIFSSFLLTLFGTQQTSKRSHKID